MSGLPQVRAELRREFLTRALFSSACFLVFVLLFAVPFAANKVGGVWMVALAAVMMVGIPYWLFRKNHLRAAAAVFVIGGSLPILIIFWFGRSVASPITVVQFAMVVHAAMLLERKHAVWVASGFMLFDFARVLAEQMGMPIPIYFPGTPMVGWALLTLTVAWTSPVLFLANATLHRTMNQLQLQVAELRETNARLLNSEQLRQSITETAPVGILVFNADGHNVFANSVSVARLGEEVRWSHLDRFPWPVTDYAGTPVPAGQQPFRQVMTSRRASYGTPLAIERPPGRRIYLSISVAPLGVDGGIVVACEDVTIRVEMERRHVHAERLASMGQLAGSVAHDFNNFLTVICGDSQLALAKSPLDSSLRTRLERIYKTANSAAAVCRQLLAFARRDEAPAQLFSVSALVEEHADVLRSLLMPDVALSLKLAPDLPFIMAESTLLLQVLMNLTVNARDAMPNGGTFSIQTLPLDAGLMLIVEDTGVGMDEATLNSLFDPYFTTKPVGHGTGLGMAIVYGIVQQFGGWIRVESEIGKGTRFLIRLPATPMPAAAKPQPR